MADKRPNVFPKSTGQQKTITPDPLNLSEQLNSLPISDNLTEGQKSAAQEMIEKSMRQLEERSKQVKVTYTPDNTMAKVSEHNKLLSDKYYEPKWDAPFDMIPLPSKGKLYPNVGEKVKVSFISGSDENILTSPNLIRSGEFMKVLIGRNLLEKNLRYDDLHPGDRNAILMYLRMTAFGTDYNITVYDNEGKEHNVTYDLSEIKFKPLGDTPDEAGLFKFTCPKSGDQLDFKFITCGDEDDIAKMEELDAANGETVNRTATYILQRMIIGVNGNYESDFVDSYIENNMTLLDIRAFRKHVDNIQSGVDLEIEVSVGDGRTARTFLPLNYSFFWPEL